MLYFAKTYGNFIHVNATISQLEAVMTAEQDIIKNTKNLTDIRIYPNLYNFQLALIF
jgi:hypothetical protein